MQTYWDAFIDHLYSILGEDAKNISQRDLCRLFYDYLTDKGVIRRLS